MEILEAEKILKNIEVTSFNTSNIYLNPKKVNIAIETVLNALNNSVSKDKIKAKIEELEKDLQDFEQTDNTGRFIRTKSRDYDKKKALEELLEETQEGE